MIVATLFLQADLAVGARVCMRECACMHACVLVRRGGERSGCERGA